MCDQIALRRVRPASAQIGLERVGRPPGRLFGSRRFLPQEVAEPPKGEEEQNRANSGQRQELWPDDTDSGAPEQYGLPQNDEVGVGCCQHDRLDDFRHAFTWRHAA